MFLNLGFKKIVGGLIINFNDRKLDLLTVIISNIEWKSYECRYENLIIKDKKRLKSEPNFNIVKIEIATNGDKSDNNTGKNYINCR